MPNISLVAKKSHQVLQNINSNKVGLSENSVVLVQVSKDDVAAVTRDNNNAVIHLRNGETIVIENYFNPQFPDNSLVFQEQDGTLNWVKFTNADGTIADTIQYYQIEEIEPLLYSDNFVGGILPWIAGAGAVGAIAAAASNKKDDSTPTPAPTPKPAPLSTAPTIQDKVEPKVGPVKNGESTNDTLPTIAGTGAQPNAIIKVYDGDTLIGQTTAKADGTWSLVPVKPLVDGSHKISATQTVDGVESDKSTSIQFTVDTKKPDASIDEIGNEGHINADKANISGKSEPNSEVTIKIVDPSGKVVDEKKVPVDKDGKWQHTTDKKLDDGKYEIQVTPIDQAGNQGETVKKPIVIDTKPPIISINPIKDTANTSPAITGKTEAGAKVNVKILDKDGKVVSEGAGTVTGDSWTYTPAKPLAEGKYTITAEATDKAGNVGKAKDAANLVIDHTAPSDKDVTVNHVADTNDATPEISGTTEAGTTVKIIIRDKNNNVVSEGAAQVSGTKWTYTPAKDLLDGKYSVTAEATDSANNTGKSQAQTFEVDTVPPVVSINPIADTANVTPAITGKTEAGATVTVKVLDKDGKVVSEGKATVTGESWSYVPSKALAEGKYTISAEATDKVGNVGKAKDSSSFAIDFTPPSDKDVTVNPIADTNITKPPISGTTEAGTTVKVIIRDKDNNIVETGSAVVNGNKWSYATNKDLADGKYSVTAEATDSANNTGKSEAQTFEVDTVPPVVTINTIADTANVTPAITGKTEAGATVTVKVLDKDGKVVSEGKATVTGETWSYVPAKALAEGKYTIAAEATDKAGNVGKAKDAASLVIDYTPPSDKDVTVNPIADTNITKPPISGNTEAGTTVKVYIRDKNNNIVESGSAVVSGNKWTYATSKDLTDGKYSVTAEATDSANNTGKSQPQTFEVDTVAPDVTIDEIKATNKSQPTLSGKAEAGSTVTITLKDKNGNTATTAKVTADNTGKWSFVPEKPLVDGRYTVEATASDKVGNTSAKVITRFDLDVTPPVDLTIDTIGNKDHISNEAKPKIYGTGEKNSIVDLVITGPNGFEEKATFRVDKDGKWIYISSVNLADGAYKIVVTPKDDFGNVGNKTEQKFTIDTTAPDVEIDPLDNDPNVLIDPINNKPNVKVDPIDNTSKVEIDPIDKKPDAKVDPINTAPDVEIDPLDDAPDVQIDSLEIVAQNVKPSFDFVSAINTNSAGPAILTNPSITYINNPQRTFTGLLKGEAAEVNVVIKNEFGVVVASGTATLVGSRWSFTPSKPLADGVYVLEAKSKDSVGNIGSTSKLSFGIDTIAPKILIEDLKPTNDNTPLIKGLTEPNATVQVTIKDLAGKVVATGYATVDASGKWSYEPSLSIIDGKYTVEAVAIDRAKNTGSGSKEILIDTVAPDAPTGVFDKTNTTITGTAEANSTVTLKINGKVVGTTTADANGKYSYKFDAPVKDKAGVDITATDAASNVSPAGKAKIYESFIKANDDVNTISYSSKPSAGLETSGKFSIQSDLASASVINVDKKNGYGIDAVVGKANMSELAVRVADNTVSDISFNAINFLGIGSKGIFRTVDMLFRGAANAVAVPYNIAANLIGKISFGNINIKEIQAPKIIEDVYASLVDLNTGKIVQTIQVGKEFNLLIASTTNPVFGTFKDVKPGSYKIILNDRDPSFLVDQFEKAADLNFLEFKGVIINDSKTKVYDDNVKNKIFGNVITDGNANDVADLSSSKLTVVQAYSVSSSKDVQQISYISGDFIEVKGLYGVLKIFKDGSYSYQLNSKITNNIAGKSDVFNYKVINADGLDANAKLTIKIDDANLTYTSKDTVPSDLTITANTDFASLSSNTTEVIDKNLNDKFGNVLSVGDANILKNSFGKYSLSLAEVNIGRPNQKLSFEVKQGYTQDLTLEVGGGGIDFQSIISTITDLPMKLIGLHSKVTLDLVDSVTGEVVKSHQYAGQVTNFALFAINNGEPLVLKNVPAGSYKVNMRIQASEPIAALVPKLANINLFEAVTLKVVDSTAYKLPTVSGNVIDGGFDETGKFHGKDVTSSKVVVSNIRAIGEAKGYELDANSVVVKGKYGTLTIYNNGQYSYTLTDRSEAVDRVDSFTYTIKNAFGKTSSDTLNIKIDSNGSLFSSTASSDLFISAEDKSNKLVFNLLDKTSDTGGNVSNGEKDIWVGFKKANTNNLEIEKKDFIDISKLFNDQNVTKGNIANYISVRKEGNDTIISIDRDGKQGANSSKFVEKDLLLLKNVDVTLDELLKQNQLIF